MDAQSLFANYGTGMNRRGGERTAGPMHSVDSFFKQGNYGFEGLSNTINRLWPGGINYDRNGGMITEMLDELGGIGTLFSQKVPFIGFDPIPGTEVSPPQGIGNGKIAGVESYSPAMMA